MKVLFYSLLSFLVFNCQANKNLSQKEEKAEKISKEDSLFIESELLQYKNCLFSDMYQLGLENTYKKLGHEQHLEKKVKDLTYYFYGGAFNPAFMLDDLNRNKLFNKWLNDKTYESVPELVTGSLDMVRALDFYNSKDLKHYLDSLKMVEYKRINDNMKRIDP